jgi:ubiquinone/menaquinone biosynthesis C-methylase UbiE
MTDTRDPAPTALDKVRDHYRATGLTERLRTTLLAFGPEDQRLSPERLAPLDQFHTRGLAATADLARMTEITSSDRVLDVGSGVGGPARFLAATYGCEVVGVDLSEPFTEAARYLTERTGQAEKVRFETGNALDLPFENDCFDAVFLQHVAMNIADRAGLYAEIQRALKPGGRFATFDILRAAGEPHYPVPWARTPETSCLLTERETRDAIEAAGFRMRAWHDDTDTAKAWFTQAFAAGPPPAPNLGVVMGPEFPGLTGNLARSILEGRVRVLAAVFDKP